MPEKELSAETSHGVSPLNIVALEFNSKSVSQATQTPCAPNEITICLTPTVKLLDTCKNAYNEASWGRFPWITISGLIGSKTRDILLNLDSQNPAGKFESSISWDQDQGQLILKPVVGLDENVDACVTFTLRNPARGQTAVPVSISADIMTNTQALLGNTLGISFPVFSATVAQTSPFPCDINTLSVALKSNLPMHGYCNNQITVTGLCGTIP